MANKKNKVKFGLTNVHYSRATFDEDTGDVIFAKPVRIPGAVNLTMDPEGSPETFWADSIAYAVLPGTNSYSGDLEIALVPESFSKDILHDEEDANGVLIESDNEELEHFALLFEMLGDKHKTRHVLYNCTSSRPSIESSTTEDTKEPQTDTLELSATPLPSGIVKAKTGVNTAQSVYDAWFDAVYLPQGTTVTDDPTEEAQG